MHSSPNPWLAIRLIFPVFVSAFLFSCPVDAPDVSDDTGITIAIGDDINARTLAPPTDMVAAKYTITGNGPGAATFTAVTTGAPVNKTGLTIGSWTITVEASNAAGTVIGSGSGTAELSNGVKTAVTVTVSPVSGTGTLSLAITWPVGQIAVPTINASLIPVLGSAQPIVFAIAGTGAAYSNAALANGYYTLSFTLLDGGINVAGAVTVVRIVTGQTTSGILGRRGSDRVSRHRSRRGGTRRAHHPSGTL